MTSNKMQMKLQQYMFTYDNSMIVPPSVESWDGQLHPCRTRRDHRGALVLCGWRLYIRTWNPITSLWMMQLTWLRIVHSGDCYTLLVVHARTEWSWLQL